MYTSYKYAVIDVCGMQLLMRIMWLLRKDMSNSIFHYMHTTVDVVVMFTKYGGENNSTTDRYIAQSH